MAWPTCPLGSHGAAAGGLQPKEDGVTSKAGGLLGIFVMFSVLPVIWTKELVLSRGKTHKTQLVTTRAQQGCLLANFNFWAFNVPAFRGAGEIYLFIYLF